MKDRATAVLRLYEAVMNRKMYAPPGEYFIGIVGTALAAMKADSLVWAAGWIEGSVPPDADARLREFAANMAMTIRSQVEVAARPEVAAIAALQELVRLKDIKDRLDYLESPCTHPNALPTAQAHEAYQLNADYKANKPKAWAAARAVLSPQRTIQEGK